MIKEIFLSAFCFSLFGFICMFGNLIFLPIVLFRLNKIKIVRNFCRDLVFVSWRLFLILGAFGNKIKYNFDNLDTKNIKSCLIIANHPSLLDVVFMLSHLRRINCVVKADLTKNIFLFGAIKASGYITNKDPESMLNESLQALKNGENLLIFPEGTRTKTSINFHKAPFYLAINAAKKLYPFFIKMDKYCLKRESKWYETPSVNYKIKLGKCIDLSKFASNKQNPLRVRNLFENLQSLYKKEFSNE